MGTLNGRICVVGSEVMGLALGENFEGHGLEVVLHNRTMQKAYDFVAGPGQGKRFIVADTPEKVVSLLERPRKVMLMVKEGKPVDEFIDKFLPLLEPGDILIDGGNSHFLDSERRTKLVEAAGKLYIATGVSGGEEGARNGPAIMPGGSPAAWPTMQPIFEAVAAKVGPNADIPCVRWIGERGAGHYVKMVHNGIEYGDMQLICEAYWMLKKALGLSNDEIADIFETWYKAELNSYLVEITCRILRIKDPAGSGKYLVDLILDTAGAKGTGKWMSQLALDLGVPSTLVTQAVFARCLSALKETRVRASTILPGPSGTYAGSKQGFVAALRQALYASKIVSYAQGYVQMQAASREYKWDLEYGPIALLWRGGCIIRAVFLERIKEAFDRNPSLENLLFDEEFLKVVTQAQNGWRHVVQTAVGLGIPCPALATALNYYDGLRAPELPANLLQGQRDYFGRHTFVRTDTGEKVSFDWPQLVRDQKLPPL